MEIFGHISAEGSQQFVVPDSLPVEQFDKVVHASGVELELEGFKPEANDAICWGADDPGAIHVGRGGEWVSRRGDETRLCDETPTPEN